jgi:hypothetical protein
MPGNNNNGTRHGGPGKGPGKKAARMMSRRQKKAENKSAAVVDRAFRGNAGLRIGVVDGKIEVGHVPVKMNDGTMVPRARIPGKIGMSKRQARAGGLLVIEKGKRVVLDGEDIVGVFDPEQDRKYRLLTRGNSVSRSKSRSASPLPFEAGQPYEPKGLAEALATRKAGHKAAKQKAKAEAAENAKKAAVTVAKIEREMAAAAKPVAFQEITIPGQKKKKEVKFGFKPESA